MEMVRKPYRTYMEDKLIITSVLRVYYLSDDVKMNLIKQMIGGDFKDERGNVIGKILDAEITNSADISIKAEITDRYHKTHIREGVIKQL